MSKIIQFKDMSWEQKENGFNLFLVEFEDDKGRTFSWAPKWDDLCEIFISAPATESLNDGDDWLPLIEVALKAIASVANNFIGQPLRLGGPGERRGRKYIRVNIEGD